jgi:uncharacterized membrane protein
MNRRRGVGHVALLGAVILGGAILRFWQLGELALIGDESYYWLWSRHLDWAYFDHPAGVALLTWLSTTLGGPSETGIRWLNALLGAGCIFWVWKLGRRMLSRQAGLFAALIVATGAPYLLTSRFVYTDALQLFLLLVNLYTFWRLVQQRPRPNWATSGAFALTLALLLNTKYNAYLYVLALGLAVLVDHRHLLGEVRFWASIGLASLGLLPVILWNAAHDWVSIRWQLSHLGFSLTGDHSLLGGAYHSLAYLTWPLVAVALLGLWRVRNPAGRLLSLVALFLLLPVALSPANSPRNLSSGLVALVLLAGARLPKRLHSRRQVAVAVLFGLLAVATAVYGLGTTVALSGPSSGPQSSVVSDIRRDAAGWRHLGPELAAYPPPVYALDYSIASQIWYYSGRPAYTSWGQYRIWGIPDLHDVTVAGLTYLSEDLVTDRLRQTFHSVSGPQLLTYDEWGATKQVRIWQADGALLDQATFLQQFDCLNLLEAER